MLTAIHKFFCNLWNLILYVLRFYRGKVPKPSGCSPCPPAVKKPDPFLYSQPYLMSLGQPVTWDNPDIFIYLNGVLVDPHDLHASTTYTVVARVWNNSTDVPVVDLPVVFSYLSFGAGTQSHPIGQTTVNLSVRGLPGCPAFAAMAWTTPATLGHYCLQVLLQPPDDSNWLNNLGQRNTDVAQAHSPATFAFAVGNHGRKRARQVRFTLDTYAIPPLEPCSAKRAPPSRIAPPIPDGWTIALTPETLTLAPDAEAQVQVAVTPPPGFTGTLPVNVHVWDQNLLIGGVTLVVEAS